MQWSHKQQHAIKIYGKTLIESVCIDAGRLYSVRWIMKYKDLNRWWKIKVGVRKPVK
jgi:hypothetical protein